MPRPGDAAERRRVLCRVEGCPSQARARGLCKKHLTRYYRHGNTATTMPSTPGPRRPLIVDIARLAAMDPHPDWQQSAACKGRQGDVFFPGRTKAANTDLAEARAICADCPVRYDCLKAGLDEKFGVWGGATEQERRKVRAELREHRRSAA